MDVNDLDSALKMLTDAVYGASELPRLARSLNMRESLTQNVAP